MCCGQKRAELRSSPATASTQAPSQSGPNSTPSQTVGPQTHAAGSPRTAYRPSPSQASPSSVPAAPAPAMSASNSLVTVRYVDHPPVRVQGLQMGGVTSSRAQTPSRLSMLAMPLRCWPPAFSAAHNCLGTSGSPCILSTSSAYSLRMVGNRTLVRNGHMGSVWQTFGRVVGIPDNASGQSLEQST